LLFRTQSTVDRPNGSTATAGLLDRSGATPIEIDVPAGAKLPPGARSFASIGMRLGTSVSRAHTTVAWPLSPTAARRPVIVGAGPSPSWEIVAGAPKSPPGPGRTAARTWAVAIEVGFSTQVATAVPPRPTASSPNAPAPSG
jgi:hypothetical protein